MSAKRTSGKNGRLLYNERYDCWEVLDAYPKPVLVHCGEVYGLRVGEQFLPCRIELEEEWVIYVFQTRFILHPDVSYWVWVT
jgi:hypothetical protein